MDAMSTKLTLTYRVLGEAKVVREVASVEEAVQIWSADRDTAFFGASEVALFPKVRDGKKLVAEIYYNGKIERK